MMSYLQYPGVLWVAIVVLCGAQSMCDTLDAVNDGTGKVVYWIHPGEERNIRGLRTHTHTHTDTHTHAASVCRQ